MRNFLIQIFLVSLIFHESSQKVVTCVVNGGTCQFSSQTIGKTDTVSISLSPSSANPNSIISLTFSSSSFYYLPAEFFSRFPNLQTLYMTSQGVYEIRPKTFINAKKLTLLRIDGNHLVELYEGIFEGLTSLTYLCLDVMPRLVRYNGAFKGESLIL